MVQLVLERSYKVLLEQLEHKEHKVYKDYLVTGASGSSIPSGLDMQIQYNDNGVLGADADFVWNKVTNDLILTGIDAGIILGNNN
jgi:opacity protein-like surface antigen